MSRFSRGHDAHLTPPGNDCGPSAWSEELCGILEEAGLQQGEIDHAVLMFDKAIESEYIVPLTLDDLFIQAGYCSEFDSTSATFWRNKKGQPDSVAGVGFADVLSKVITTVRGDELTEECEQVSDYLWALVGAGKLSAESFNAACEVLLKLRRTYVYAAPPVVVDEAMVERAREAYKATKRWHTGEYPEGPIYSVADMNKNDDAAWASALAAALGQEVGNA